MLKKILIVGVILTGLLTPAWAQEGEPTATPVPVCSESDLAGYALCLAACDAAAVETCVSPGSEDHFLSILEAGIAGCNYPGIDTPRKWNGLKKIPGAFVQMGSLAKAKGKQLARGVEKCIRALEKERKGKSGRGRN